MLNWEQAQNEYTSHVQIILDKNKTDVEELTSSLKEMSTSEGSPIVINYSGGIASGDIALPKDISISLSDDSISLLRQLCGNNNVQLVYHPRPNLH